MNDTEAALLRQMISELGKMWLDVRDRTEPAESNVIICTSPYRAFYLGRVNTHPTAVEFMDGWHVTEQILHFQDAEYFFAEFGHHWPYWIGCIVRGRPLRAFIKNGRHQGWSISLGPSE